MADKLIDILNNFQNVKRLDTQLNEPTNQKSQKLLIKRIIRQE